MKAAAAVILLTLVAAAAQAQPRPAAPDPLVAVADADPLELARVAARLGDAAVIARLDARKPAAVRLAAIRATPMLAAPENALLPLARIAAGRDPHLAPAAAAALLQIAAALDAPSLDRHEVLRSDLAPARTALRALAADTTARPDLRRAASHVAAALTELGVR